MSKRKLLLGALLALLLMLLTAPALADSYKFGTVDANGKVNLRASASTSSARIGSCTKGTWLRVISQSGSWYKVTTPNGVTGWMYSDYVFISAAAKGTIGIVDVNSSLTLRKSASSSSRSLGKYPDGTPCILLSESGDWYHVTVDGKAGYFDADYVDKKYMVYASELATVDSANGGSVNLRRGPGTKYASVKTVKDGAIVMVLQKGSGWWKVSANGTVGYMDTDYLRDGVKTVSGSSDDSYKDDDDDSGSTDIGSSSSGGFYATVKVNSKLNLRKYADSDSASLGTFANGTRVYVLRRGSEWCQVSVGGKTGYMATRYLRFGNSSSGSTNDDDSTSVSGVMYAEIKLSGGSARLHLRTTASSSSASMGTYPRGTMVKVLSKGTNWCRVQVDGLTGYMATRYLAFDGLSTSIKTMYADHPEETYVNLRREPDLETGKVLVRVPHGAQVQLIKYGRTWCQVSYNGKTGYMMTKFLED